MSMIKLGVFYSITENIVKSPRYDLHYFVRREDELRDWEQEVDAALRGPVPGIYDLLITIFGHEVANELVDRGELPSIKRSQLDLDAEAEAEYLDSGEFRSMVDDDDDEEDDEDDENDEDDDDDIENIPPPPRKRPRRLA